MQPLGSQRSIAVQLSDTIDGVPNVFGAEESSRRRCDEVSGPRCPVRMRAAIRSRGSGAPACT
jgi:hypothetical protein